MWRSAVWDRTPGVSVPPGPDALRVVTLGDFIVARGGRVIELGQHQARQLLAILVCAGGPVHRERLMGWLWPHLPDARALTTLHSTVYTLRRRLEPERGRPASMSVVRADGEAYRLVWRGADMLDATEFVRRAHLAAQAPGASTRIERLREAEAAYTGPFLPQWPRAEWAAVARADIEQSYETVAGDLAGLLAATGRETEAIALYRRLLAIDPERETWHRGLMEIFIAQGDRSRAAHQFEACRTVLRERLGIEPSPKTQRLFASLADSRAKA